MPLGAPLANKIVKEPLAPQGDKILKLYEIVEVPLKGAPQVKIFETPQAPLEYKTVEAPLKVPLVNKIVEAPLVLEMPLEAPLVNRIVEAPLTGAPQVKTLEAPQVPLE